MLFSSSSSGVVALLYLDSTSLCLSASISKAGLMGHMAKGGPCYESSVADCHSDAGLWELRNVYILGTAGGGVGNESAGC